MNAKLIGSLAGLALMIGAANAQDPDSKVKDSSAQVKDPLEQPLPGAVTPPNREKPSSNTTTMGTSPADRSSASDRGTGGSGTTSGTVPSTPSSSDSAITRHDLGKNEVTGKVVRADKNTVYVDHMGAVVPLKIEPNTKFESAGITKANDLKEGQEIRASFTVKDKTTNVATSIWLEGATSGANKPGTDMDTHRRTATSPNRPTTTPEDKGTHPDNSKK
jgi:hypothetical protein